VHATEVRSLIIEKFFDGITIYLDVSGYIRRLKEERAHAATNRENSRRRLERPKAFGKDGCVARYPDNPHRKPERLRAAKVEWYSPPVSEPVRDKQASRLVIHGTNKQLNTEILQYVFQRGGLPIFYRHLTSINDSPDESYDFFKHVQVLEINADDIIYFVYSMRTCFPGPETASRSQLRRRG
jgi:hypothetical protein